MVTLFHRCLSLVHPPTTSVGDFSEIVATVKAEQSAQSAAQTAHAAAEIHQAKTAPYGAVKNTFSRARIALSGQGDVIALSKRFEKLSDSNKNLLLQKIGRLTDRTHYETSDEAKSYNQGDSNDV